MPNTTLRANLQGFGEQRTDAYNSIRDNDIQPMNHEAGRRMMNTSLLIGTYGRSGDKA